MANNIEFWITGKGERDAWDGPGYCYLGFSKSESAFLQDSFLLNSPRLEFHPPRRKFHLDKVAFERNWMARRFQHGIDPRVRRSWFVARSARKWYPFF